nr:hypothetical protein CFP56_62130 [Quercus suber]
MEARRKRVSQVRCGIQTTLAKMCRRAAAVGRVYSAKRCHKGSDWAQVDQSWSQCSLRPPPPPGPTGSTPRLSSTCYSSSATLHTQKSATVRYNDNHHNHPAESAFAGWMVRYASRGTEALPLGQTKYQQVRTNRQQIRCTFNNTRTWHIRLVQ